MVFVAAEAFSCVMVPSVWKTIKSSTDELQCPTVYAITEAFMQLRKKITTEMKVCNIPIKPFAVRSLFASKEGEAVNKDVYSSVKEAYEITFNNASIPDFDKLPKVLDLQNQGINTSDKCYYLDLYVFDSKRTCVNMIDLNMQIWALLRLVVRDEATVYVRASDSKDNVFFVDEFEVSPTIVIEPLLTPLGGFFKTFERNNYMPLHIDWGSVGDSKEHVLRINTSFYPSSDVPPLEIFKSDIVKSLEKEERENDENSR